VEIANITFVETQVRAGKSPNPAMAPQLPTILGNGVGGIVAAVGASADPRLVGRQVVSTTGGSGGYAERVVVTANSMLDVPEGLRLPDAVALLADGRTATALMRTAAVRPRETVIVEAAAGGVGTLLLQLARNAGATVVALAGGERKTALATELGADIALDYSAPGWAEDIRARLGGIDVVFDGVGGTIGQQTFGLLRSGGRFCSFGLASGAFTRIPDGEAEARGITVIRGAPMSPQEMSSLTKAALDEAAADKLRPVIGQTFPLDRAADAHAAIETRATIGKTLLLVR
jgi:NADPH2:quinone reductase